MAMHDEIKEQKSKLKGKTRKEKLSYFWDYYKIHTIAAFFIIIIAGIFIKDAIEAKDSAFSATLLNAYGTESQENLQIDFAQYAGIDLNIYDCFIDTGSTLSYDTMAQMDLAVSQRIMAMAQTGGIDVIISDLPPFINYAEGSMFIDLKEVLTPEEYETYEPSFFYIDQAALDRADEENDALYDEEGNLSVVDGSIDHRNPAAMEEPIAVGIYLDNSSRIKEWNLYSGQDQPPVFGFVYSSEKPELCHTFLEYMMK